MIIIDDVFIYIFKNEWNIIVWYCYSFYLPDVNNCNMCFKVLEDIGCGNSEIMSNTVSCIMYKILLIIIVILKVFL